MSFWQNILDVFHAALVGLQGILEPLFGVNAWGWSIIALTLIARVLLLPLAIKQTRSMRAMQALQPKIKKLQAKYKVDRELMKKDPETYRAKKQKLNEEMMALYKEEGVNPAGGCLPLLLQAPIFFALFSVLRDTGFTDLQNAPFYFFTSQASGDVQGLGIAVNQAGWPGWILIVLMAGTMFWSQRQMMARSGSVEGVQAQQQKLMMYAMPVFLAFVSLNLPMGVLLYWVTTNLWQMGQQAVIMREVEHHPAPVVDAEETGRSQDPSSNGKAPRAGGTKPARGSSRKKKTPPADYSTKRTPRANQPKGGHLPKRKGSEGST